MTREKISDARRNVVKSFTMKRLVVGRGHDCGGLIADVYFKKKMVATFHDDGWGGEPELRFLTDKGEEDVKKFLAENNYAQLMFENGWDFMEESSKIGFETQVEDVVCSFVHIQDEEKSLKKSQTKGFVLEKDGIQYTQKFPMGITKLKANKDFNGWLHNMKRGFKKDGYEVLNTNL